MSNWSNKIVAISGGSKGLGLEVARAFAERGAKCVAIARDVSEAKVAMGQWGAGHLAFSADVTKESEVEQVVEKIVGHHGQIDVWVNCVGKSLRKEILQTSPNDYRELMEVNFYSSVNCTLAVLPWLQKSNGSLVNIGSLASKTAWPLVGPYACSKHALAAFTQQLRIEGPECVHVLHVCPGPIARADSGNRYDAQAYGLSEKANTPGAGAPVKLIDPKKLANQIIFACEKRKPEIVTSLKSRLLFSISQLFPTFGDWLIRRFSK